MKPINRKKRWRRFGLALSLLGGVLVLSSCIFLPDFAGQKRAGKYEPIEQPARPASKAATPSPERQTEPHTCGLHAMCSLYRAYGLSPNDFDLRFRLGTDEPAMRADADSTGTLHPDLYRVLAQDGFETTPIGLSTNTAASDLLTHLQAGQLALAVVYRSTYHWVLLAGDGDGRVRVVDSLTDALDTPSAEVFVADALSITLVRPAEPGSRVSVSDAHAAGLREMARLARRR